VGEIGLVSRALSFDRREGGLKEVRQPTLSMTVENCHGLARLYNMDLLNNWKGCLHGSAAPGQVGAATAAKVCEPLEVFLALG
jgi:hypothetical protein